MGKPIVVLGQREIDKINAMPRKELNAECLHLMREQMELTLELHELRKHVSILERLYEATKNWRYGLIDKVIKGSDLAATHPAIYRLAMTFDEVEATDK